MPAAQRVQVPSLPKRRGKVGSECLGYLFGDFLLVQSSRIRERVVRREADGDAVAKFIATVLRVEALVIGHPRDGSIRGADNLLAFSANGGS